MERKIGEIFEYNGEWYQCVIGCYCDDCTFKNDNCEERERITLTNKLTKEEITGLCTSELRSDGKSVIFKKLEKVGEPFTIVGTLYQHYKVLDIDNVCGDGFWCVHNYKAKTLTIEVKQNKEDMEEKKLNLKPFDIQKAREGKPVCTRDGRRARIICFDAEGNKPLIVLSKINGHEVILRYTEKGQSDNFHSPTPREDDLMMLPEKKEGWVNIYYEHDAPSHREASWVYDKEEEAIKVGKEHGSCYIATVRIEWEE